MATTFKNAGKATKAAPAARPASQEVAVQSAATTTAQSNSELIEDNIVALSTIAESQAITLDMLIEKISSMAHHIIATEAVLAEMVATYGVDLAKVNARIRTRIAAGTDNFGNSEQAIDAAASIASPLPRR